MSRIFNKSKAGGKATGRDGGRAAYPAVNAKKACNQEDLTFHLDIPVDDAIRSLDARLSSFSRLEVGQAAKERGWASLQRELNRHPVRAASPALLKGTGARSSRPGRLEPVVAGRGRGWRIALGSAGVTVAIVAVLIGTYAAGLLGNGGSGPVVSVTTSEVAVVTTTPTVPVTPTTQETVETSVPPSTNGTQSTGSTGSTNDTTVTTEDTTPSSGPATTSGGSTVTTKPAATTTTNDVQMASAERVKNAKDAVFHLGDAVLAYFMNDGKIEDARSLVGPSAKSNLTQMISSLDEPTQMRIVDGSAKALDSETLRLTLEFTDVNDTPRFFVTVHVDDQGATITAISAGS